MWNAFILENIHFAEGLLVALVFFASAWLYFDAWLERKTTKDFLKVLGFILLALSFWGEASLLESSILTTPLLNSQLFLTLFTLSRLIGYTVLIFGLLSEPLQAKPGHKGLESERRAGTLIITPSQISLLGFLPFSFPFLAGAVAFLYLRRATKGLESHLKTLSFSFYVLSFYELISLRQFFEETTNLDLYNLVAPFGPIWILEQVVLLIAITILGRWVFYYLLKRLKTQLFMIFTFLILTIFLLTTLTFTGLLLKNIQDETLSHLETNVKVLNYAVESKKAESLSDAQSLAQNPLIESAIEENEIKVLADTAQSFLLSKKLNYLVITSDSGVVLARGEDRERVGDSLSDEALVKRALLGESVTGIVTKDGVMSPEVSVRAATPIKVEDEIIGAVMTGFVIDNAFVDGIKTATGLEVAVYGDNILSASTLLLADGYSRYIGIKEENKKIKDRVLGKGEGYTGSLNLINTPYFTSFLPLKDVDGNPVGMLFVGMPQLGVLEVAGKSIETTFITTAILLIISIIPAYFIARHLSYQIK